jgi:putative DNA primase/helicase
VIITDTFPLFRECIPEELKRGRCWVCCNRRKAPYVALVGKKESAKSTDPDTWRSYSEALEAFATGRYAGIGRVIGAEEGLVGVDLDGVRGLDTGHIADRARSLLDRLDSYSEVSPSGKGVKVWVYADLPKSHVKSGLEVYTRGRYFTVTGQMLLQYPATIGTHTTRGVRGAISTVPYVACAVRMTLRR